MVDLMEPTIAEMVADGQCPHETTRETPYFREMFCFDCGAFIDVVTGALALDGKTRIPLDDDIDAVEREPFTSLAWPRLLDSLLIIGMGSPDRPTLRAIFRGHRAWVKACERAGGEAFA